MSKFLTDNEAVEFLSSDEETIFLTYQKKAFQIVKERYFPVVTFSRNVFIPLTFLCRNKCAYCSFHYLQHENNEAFLSLDKIESTLELARKKQVSEVLLTLGEKPEENHERADKWLTQHGYNSTIDYLYIVAQVTIEKGLLPHINAGIMDLSELKKLKKVSASMGLMLETTSQRLMKKGKPHEFSPGKNPLKRIETITNAGKLKIPLTTGLLIGIGENDDEIIEAIISIKKLSEKYEHIQEVIIQGFQPQELTKMATVKAPTLRKMEKVIIIARLLLDKEVSIQTPPNLTSMTDNEKFLYAGINDWGGVSEITPDYVNIDHSWPSIHSLEQLVNKNGFTLKERLPIYPNYINSKWCSSQIMDLLSNKYLSMDESK